MRLLWFFPDSADVLEKVSVTSCSKDSPKPDGKKSRPVFPAAFEVDNQGGGPNRWKGPLGVQTRRCSHN